MEESSPRIVRQRHEVAGRKATRKLQSGQRDAGRKLRFEALENRCLLAVASFEVNLFEDSNGAPGDVITSDTVQVGQTFFVEITARENHPLFSGLRGVALDISWDPNVLKEVDTSFDPGDPASPLITSHFPLFRRGTLDNDSGTIDDLAGYAFLSTDTGRAIGNRSPERFSLMRFQAVGTTESSTFHLEQGRSRIATVPVSSLRRQQLYFEPQTITVVGRDYTPQVDHVESAIAESGPLIVEQQIIETPIIETPIVEPQTIEPQTIESQIVESQIVETQIVEPQGVGPLPADVYFTTVLDQATSHPGQVNPHKVAAERNCWTNEVAIILPRENLPVSAGESEGGASQAQPPATRSPVARSTATGIDILDTATLAYSISDPAFTFFDPATQMVWSIWPGPEPTLRIPSSTVVAMGIAPESDKSAANNTSAELTAATDAVFASDDSVTLLEKVEQDLSQLAAGWWLEPM